VALAVVVVQMLRWYFPVALHSIGIFITKKIEILSYQWPTPMYISFLRGVYSTFTVNMNYTATVLLYLSCHYKINYYDSR